MHFRPLRATDICRNFDFDADERWKAYVINLEIPPGRNTSSVLLRFKAKWYKREVVRTITGSCAHRSSVVCMTCNDMACMQDPSFDPNLVLPAFSSTAKAPEQSSPSHRGSDEAPKPQAKPADAPASPGRPASQARAQARSPEFSATVQWCAF